MDNLDLKVDPENMIFRFKSNGIGLSLTKTFEEYKEDMESKVTSGAELGEDDGEEWVAYIINAYLCFKDFDSYGDTNSNLTKSKSKSKSINITKSREAKSSNSKSIPSARKLPANKNNSSRLPRST